MAELWAYSIYGAETRKGLVKIVKDKEVLAMLTPAEAREWAANLYQAAEAAETDEFLMAMFKDRIGLDDEKAVAVLTDFRRFRDGER